MEIDADVAQRQFDEVTMAGRNGINLSAEVDSHCVRWRIHITNSGSNRRTVPAGSLSAGLVPAMMPGTLAQWVATALIGLACCGAMEVPMPHGGSARSGRVVGMAGFACLASAAAGAGWAVGRLQDLTDRLAKRARVAPDGGHSSCLEEMAMSHLTQGDGADDYAQLSRDLRALIVSPDVGFVRPPPKQRRRGNGRLVQGQDAMVPVLDDKLRHLLGAIEVHATPEKSPTACLRADDRYHLSDATERAILDMLELHHGGTLPQWRNSRIEAFNSIAARAKALDARIKAVASPAPDPVVKLGRIREVNVALLVLLVDALDWPDKLLPMGFLVGFRVVGIIPDSGVHRPLDPPPLGDLQAFQQHHDTTMATNVQWAADVAKTVSTNAKRAMRDKAHPERLATLHEVWDATMKEVKGMWMGPGLTLDELLDQYGNVDGSRPQNGPKGTLNARVMMRHGVYQGYKQKKDNKGRPMFGEDGQPVLVRKLRCIDDARTSLSNSCQYTYETNEGRPTPRMVLSTDDMRAAYRQIPCSQPGHTMVCIYKFGKNAGPRFFPVHDFNFGHVSSVVTYNRCPELLVHAARKLFLCVTEHYFDDYVVCDVIPQAGHSSERLCRLGHSRAQQAISAVHKAGACCWSLTRAPRRRPRMFSSGFKHTWRELRTSSSRRWSSPRVSGDSKGSLRSSPSAEQLTSSARRKLRCCWASCSSCAGTRSVESGGQRCNRCSRGPTSRLTCSPGVAPPLRQRRPLTSRCASCTTFCACCWRTFPLW